MSKSLFFELVYNLKLTCHGEGDDLGDDAADAVPGDALVVPSVPPTHRLELK